MTDLTAAPERFRVLISYHYFRKVDLDKLFGEQWPGPPPEVFADSGAFSAMTQGADVRVDEYATWLEQWKHWFQIAANLDVIGDDADASAGTLANQAYLEDKGLHVLPVFHAGEPWPALEHYLDNGYPYVALGGLVGRPVPSIMAWLVQCFRLAKDRAVFHGFGLTSWEPLADLPWYSVDSLSWGASYRYGQVRLFDLRRGRWVQASVGNHAELFAPRVAQLMREHGFDPADFSDRTRYTRERACRLAAVAWWRAEQWVRQRHGPVPMPGGGRAPGLRWYCADGSGPNLSDGANGLKLYLSTARSEGSDGYNGAKEHAARIASINPGLNLYLAVGGPASDLTPLRRFAGDLTQGATP